MFAVGTALHEQFFRKIVLGFFLNVRFVGEFFYRNRHFVENGRDFKEFARKVEPVAV